MKRYEDKHKSKGFHGDKDELTNMLGDDTLKEESGMKEGSNRYSRATSGKTERKRSVLRRGKLMEEERRRKMGEVCNEVE